MLQELLDRKISAIDNADSLLEKALQAMDRNLFDRLMELLTQLDQKNGLFVNSQRNINLLSTFARAVQMAMTAPGYKDTVNDYLHQFGVVKEINYEMVQTVAGKEIPVSDAVNATMKNMIDTITDVLTDYKNIDKAVRVPLQQILVRHVTLGSSFKEAEYQLREFMKTDEEGLGHMGRWAGQITKDAIMAVDGEINWAIVGQTGLDGFRIVTGLQDNSRKTCVHMVLAPAAVVTTKTKGKGAQKTTTTTTENNIFADIALGRSMYRIADIPIIIERSKDLPGWNKNTTATTYFRFRNGYRCRHMFIPFKLGVPKQRKQIEKLN
jgi:hypothetical protein